VLRNRHPGSQDVLSIVFVGAKRMRAVNLKYLKHDHATDVLTFDLDENLSEIIICPQIAHINAKEHRNSTQKEIILYVIHGILHLAGYDDHSPQDILQMRKMEIKLLNLFPSPKALFLRLRKEGSKAEG